MKRIYADHAATTPLRSEVLEAMMPYLTDFFGNASTQYEEGQAARHAVENARRQVAQLIHASHREICFTSGGSESDNWAITEAAHFNQEKGRHLVTTAIEHAAVLNSFRKLEKEGFSVTYLPVDQNGLVSVSDLEKALREDTILVSVMTANNELGCIEPIAQIGSICHERGILFHTDAVQAVGKIPLDVHAMNVDLLSVSAHKLYGPKGVGALYIAEGCGIGPFIHGGKQERGLRAGTENVPGIVGFGKAAELSGLEMEENAKKITALAERLKRGLEDRIEGCRFHQPEADGIPGLLSVALPDAESESALIVLDMEGIAVSAGSACESGAVEASHVLKAIGLSEKEARSTIRISLGRENTEAEADQIAETIAKVNERLLKLRKGFR